MSFKRICIRDVPNTNPFARNLVTISGPINFQSTETDVSSDWSYGRDIHGLGRTRRTTIRLFGVTEIGQSILVHVHNFYPYMYVDCPDSVDDLRHAINAFIGKPKAIVHIEYVKRRSIWGYSPTAKDNYVKITFDNPQHVGKVRDKLQSGLPIKGQLKCYPVFEARLNFELRMMIDKGITGAGWILLDKYTLRKQRISSCQIEVDCDVDDLKARSVDDPKWMKIAPMRIVSFDIECMGRKGHFPDPKLDPIIQIAVIINQGGVDSRIIFTLKGCDPIEGALVLSFDTEPELFKAFLKLWDEIDGDLITGYNIVGFDLPYLLERGKVLDIKVCLGRIVGSESTMKDSYFESKAFGKSASKEIKIEGRVQMDVLIVIQREYKLRSYTLDSVSKHFLGQQKEDVHYSIISSLQNGDNSTRHRLAVYCIKDGCLVVRLNDTLLLSVNLIGMARVTGVPLMYLLMRGQQIKVISMLYRASRKAGLIIPMRYEPITDDKYAGATVIEPKKAFYTVPIATLDFASLYPSIMMAHNLCYSTMLEKGQEKSMSPNDYTKAPNGTCFVKPHIRKGLLPQILDELLKARAEAKKLMKTTNDPFLQAILNGRQLALKISANSVYGFTGAQVGQLCCIEISSAVTGFGRDMLMMTKDAVEKRFSKANGYAHDSDVVYGDSVTGDTPVMVKCTLTGQFLYRNIESLITDEDWEPYQGDKECINNVPFKAWTETGWTQINRIIRHKTNKDIIRVLTHTSCVDVTTDHSLLSPDGEKIKGSDVQKGTLLLHTPLPVLPEAPFEPSDLMPIEDLDYVYALGLFYAEGSCGSYECASGDKSSWAISNADNSVFDRAIIGLVRVFTHLDFKILDTIRSSGANKLVASSRKVRGGIKNLVELFRPEFYDDRKQKKVPDCILNAPIEIVQAFWEGYYAGDGDQDYHDYIRLDNKGAIGSAGLYYLMERLGKLISINTRNDKRTIYRLTACRGSSPQRKIANAVKTHVNFGPCNDFVYDLETDNHHFSAGVGRQIVHNTDSVMVRFGTDDVAESMRLGNEAAEFMSTLFITPIRLEFEKIYYPYLLMNKKRYAGLYWTNSIKYDKMDMKGIETVRRDSCRLVSEMINACLNEILINRDTQAAQEIVKKAISDLLMNRVDFSLLVISKKLGQSEYDPKLEDKTGHYKNKQAHDELRKKMIKRDAGSAPSMGDRVPYVIINGSKDIKSSDRSEDPIYALENNIPISHQYYIENQMRGPIERLFDAILPPKKIQALFVGDHTRKICKPTPKTGGIMKFAKVLKTCLGCQFPIDEGSMCDDCEPKRSIVLFEHNERLRQSTEKYNETYSTCVTCQGSADLVVICESRDCPIFYKRVQEKSDLAKITQKMLEF